VTQAEQVQALVDLALERHGHVDIMLNNAGLMPHSPLDRRRLEDWDQMIDVNIKGVLYGIAAVPPAMQAQKSGHIINVASVAGHKVRADSTVYSATKHAVRIISEGLRQETACAPAFSRPARWQPSCPTPSLKPMSRRMSASSTNWPSRPKLLPGQSSTP
jgi:NADP-dependent 3-hydroxy acid dehydrogenase YdfG